MASCPKKQGISKVSGKGWGLEWSGEGDVTPMSLLYSILMFENHMANHSSNEIYKDR